jgi:DNA-binding transcriptional LysR family regulator
MHPVIRNCIYYFFDNIMVMMFKTRRTQHFLTLVKYGHFGRAANSLGISQPALSKSIQSLEADLGVSLLNRKRGNVTVTPFGELVVARCTAWLSEEEQLRSQIALLAGQEIGDVKIALGPFPSVTSGYAAAVQLLAEHPACRIRVHSTDWREVASQVLAQEIDLGIAEVSSLQDHPDLVTEAFGHHCGFLFCRPGHPLLKKGKITLNDLFAYPWVCTRIPWRVTEGLPLKLGAAGSIDPLSGDFVPAIEINNSQAFANFVTHSDALAVTLLSAMAQELADGSVTVVPQDVIPIQAQYGFIQLKNRALPPVISAYRTLVLKIEGEITRQEAKLAKKFVCHQPGRK